MKKYDEYFLMSNDDVVEYAFAKLPDFGWDRASMKCGEIGDGNMNYVFRVQDKNGLSVIVKQASKVSRISSDLQASTDRNERESSILILQDKLAPGCVPKIYFYDTVMCACAMQDMKDYSIMRDAMIRHKVFPKFADQISSFMANTLMGTSDIVLNHKEKKALQKKYINPDLCEITEDLVYTEPYNDAKGRNNVFPPNADFVKKNLYEDNELKLEVAKLKMDFMCNAQALLHGDLHTGSIFINEENTVAFDPEFCLYGPMGYDIGNVVANMIFAWCNGDAEIQNTAERDAFCGWVEKTIVDVVDMTMRKLEAYYDEHVTDIMAKTPGYKEYYLKSILADTAGVTGLELNRRIVGMANVKDITSISDEQKRMRAERICMLSAVEFIKRRAELKSGNDFLKVMQDAVSAVKAD